MLDCSMFPAPMAQTEIAWHATPADEVARTQGVDVSVGLNAAEVTQRTARYGPNALPAPTRPSALKQFLGQFVNPLVGTLLAAAAIAVAVAVWGDSGGRGWSRFSDAIAIMTIVIVNALIGFYQEKRAEKAIEALARLSAARSRVLRDTQVVTVDAQALVPGDVVLLEAGDKVPADLRLVSASELHTVEGELTGESTSVEKSPDATVPSDAPLGDRSTMVFSGTTVVNGDARGVVVATGRETQVGRVGRLLADVEKQRSPLEERLDDFGTRVLWITVALSATLFAIGAIKGTVAWHVLLLTAVSVAVAVIPEGLPAITSITLALGMQRMAHRGAIVRKLAAVETLGCATTVCSDKTGTLTRNEMTVRAIAVVGHELAVTGEGYDDRGELLENGTRVDDPTDSVREVIRVGAVVNTSQLRREGEGVEVTGDPTEAALLALASKIQIERHSALGQRVPVLSVPFNSARKRMTVVTREDRPGGAHFTSHVKGGVDVVLPLCTRVLTDAGEVDLDDATRAALTAKAQEFSSRALRVLAMAIREGGEELLDKAEAERSLVFAGMVGMLDPPRAEVKRAIEEAHAAGIRVVMITGDHPVTAESIARELGLWDEGALTVTGERLRAMSDDELQKVLPHVRVFARVDPEHKLRIVRALQDGLRETVAMTGDGVNDAPAIKQAAIGIAMGRGGTDVAREAADMVLQDDNFATIIDAVREGRAIYRNIQKSIFFLLSSNAGLCIAVFVTSFFSPEQAPPLTALQILWINLVTNGLPALALGIDPPEPGQMREAPRRQGDPILDRRDWMGVIAIGALMAACAMAIYWLPIWSGAQTSHEVMSSKRTMVFTLLALAPLAHAFNCRSRTASIFRLGILSNPWLVGAVIVSACVHAVSIAVRGLQPVFRTDHVWNNHEIWIVVALSLLPIPAVELAKLLGFGATRPASPKP